MPVSELDATPRSDDTLTSGVQKGLAAIEGLNSSLSPEPLTNPVDTEGILKGALRAKQYLAQSGLDEKSFEPGMLETWGAYFRSENTVGSALSSRSLAETLFPTPDSPRITTADLLKRIEADKLGQYQENFVGVDTVADYEATKADLTRRLDDQRIMQASTGINSVAAMLAAGIIDLPSLLPGSIGWKLGAEGVGLAKAAVGFSGGAVLGASASEIALQATQVGRSWEESAASIGGSIILGGMLGAGAHAIAYRTLGPGVVRGIEANMEKALADLADEQAGMRSAGAAQVSAYERMKADGVDSQKSISSFGALESLKSLGKIKGWLGQNMRIPMLDLERSQSPSALSALNSLVYRVGITRANAAGEALDASPVIAHVRDYRESLVGIAEQGDEAFKANKSAFRDYADFDTQITRALIQPTSPAHPAVEKIAKMHREVYTRIVDELIEAKVLPPSVKEKYGDAYFPMVFDADAIRADEASFKKMISDGFSKQFTEEGEAALRERLGRVQANEQARKEVVGVVEKRGKVDEAGAPVINPKTGKQVQERVVLSEGAQLERDRITREQYKLRKEYLDEQKSLYTAALDEETKNLLKGVNEFRDYQARGFKEGFDKQLEEATRDATLTVSERVRTIARINDEQKRMRDVVEKERRADISRIEAEQRARRKELIDPIDRELAEAKRIQKDNLAHSKAAAKEELADRTVSIREGLEGPLRFTRDGKVDPRAVKDEADALAQRWYESTTQWNKYTLEHEIDGFTEFLKKRRTPVNHLDLLNAGFVRGNAFSILEDYIRMAGTDAAVARNFKRKIKEAGPDGKVTKESDLIEIGDLKLRSVKEDIIADYEALRGNILASPEFKAQETKLEKKYEKLAASARDDKAKAELANQFQEELKTLKGEVEKKLATQRDTDIANIEAILDAIRGTSKADASQSFKNAVETVSALNYMRLLGGTVISSLTDPVKIAIANGLGNTVQGAMLSYQQTFRSSWKSANSAQKGLGRAGAAMAELHLSARLAQMADVANPHRVDSTSVNFLRRASQVFSKASGITYWNAFWKQTSENATSAYLGQLAHRGWDKLNKSEKAWLANLRIDGDGLKLIKDAHEAQAGDKFFNDFPMLMHEDWGDRQAAQMVRHALGEELNNQVITPQGYDRMSFATTPQGRALWQFRQHMVSNQMRFIARQAQLASLDGERTASLAVGFVGLVTAGALVDYLKQVSGQVGLTGNLDRNKSATDRQLDEWTKTPGLALWNALDRSDTLGLIMEGSNVLDKTIGFGPKSALTLFDDKAALKEASRFKNRSVADVVGGPTVGLLNDTIGATKALGKIVSGQKLGRGDYRSAERLIPGQNIPYIQLLGNTAEREVGDLYSWPNPK